ncbi:MAG: WXG100 family type VII secretion target [Jatrophihabitans sp.]
MSSGGAFNTDAATMATASAHVHDVKNQIDGELKRLQGAVEGVQAHWQGAAASSFQALMVRWTEDSAKLRTALSEIGDQISQAGKSYDTQDTSSESMIKSAGSSVNI